MTTVNDEMKPSLWLENGMTPGKHVIVDCGYMKDAEQNFKALSPHLGKRNFQRVGNDRLVARIPPKKVASVLAAVPQIKEGVSGYCWCTHGFAPNAELTGRGPES